jgi:hypothetical protein
VTESDGASRFVSLSSRVVSAHLPLHSVCITTTDLLVAVQDPPSLRVLPFPTAASAIPETPSSSRLPLVTVVPSASRNSSSTSLHTDGTPSRPSHNRRSSTWEGLPAGLSGEAGSEAIMLDEWDWLVGRDRESGASRLCHLLLSVLTIFSLSDDNFPYRSRCLFFLTSTRRHPFPFTYPYLRLLSRPSTTIILLPAVDFLHPYHLRRSSLPHPLDPSTFLSRSFAFSLLSRTHPDSSQPRLREVRPFPPCRTLEH